MQTPSGISKSRVNRSTTTTPRPSSPTSTFPSPRTRSLHIGVGDVLAIDEAIAGVDEIFTRYELVAGEDRLGRGIPLHDRHEKRAVHMVNGEAKQQPHADVVKQARCLQASQERNQKLERAHRRIDVSAARIERKPGGDHQEIESEYQNVGQPRQWIVADESRWLPQIEKIETERRPQAAPPPARDRNELIPPRIAVPPEHPHHTRENGKREDDRGVGMDRAHPSQEKVVARRSGNVDEWMSDVDAGDGKENDGENDQPVRHAHRQLPDVHAHDVPAVLFDRSVAALDGHGAHTTLTFAISFPAASTTWTPHARQGSNEWMVRRISTGRFGSAMGVPINAAS